MPLRGFDSDTYDGNKVPDSNTNKSNISSYSNSDEVSGRIDDTIQDLSNSLGIDKALDKIKDSIIIGDDGVDNSVDDSSYFSGRSINNKRSSSTKTKNSKNSSVSGGGGSGTVSAKKQYKEMEYNTLSGEVSLIPTSKSLKLDVGDTITLKGFGKYLSGKYFVEKISYNLSSGSGFSQSLSVIKTGFGDSLKNNTVAKKAENSAPTKNNKTKTKVKNSKSKNTTSSTSPIKNHSSNTITVISSGGVVVDNSDILTVKVKPRTKEVPVAVQEFKVGDRVRIFGDATFARSNDGTKVPEWMKKQDLVIVALSDNDTTASLSPIWFWVYTKYLKKV